MRTRNRKADLSSKPASSTWKITALFLIFLFTILFVGGTATLSKLGMNPWIFYANVANPNLKFVSVPAGMRKEQIAELFAKHLGWDDSQKGAFIATATLQDKNNPEGVFLPGNYWVHKLSTGEQVATLMITRFHQKVAEEIINKNSANFNKKVNLDTAIKIASIIQREAAGPQDMRIISGIIWNRLFQGMKLDMDATLQYAKGDEEQWWPKVASEDKNIQSDFNTYKHKGLPPAAISNPSIEALKAAYNPAKTNCMFYLHENRQIYCSVTYEQHKENIAVHLLGKK